MGTRFGRVWSDDEGQRQIVADGYAAYRDVARDFDRHEGVLDEARLVERGADERSEERVRFEGLRFELWMGLHSDEPRVIPKLDYFRQLPVGRNAGKTEPRMLQSILVADVDLVAMAMPL